jgi:copper chaperone NosL
MKTGRIDMNILHIPSRLQPALLLLLLLLLCCGQASAQDSGDIDLHRHCHNCGMDRKSYGYSRMLLRYADGTETGVCSLNCAVVELDKEKGGQKKGRQDPALLVADRDTLELIEARSAYWVMGGNKRGVMTARPKWAFAAKEGAQAFIRTNGGTLVGWEEVLGAAQADALAHH